MGISEKKENRVKAVAQVTLERKIIPLFPKSVINMLIQNPRNQGGGGTYQLCTFCHSWPLRKEEGTVRNSL